LRRRLKTKNAKAFFNTELAPRKLMGHDYIDTSACLPTGRPGGRVELDEDQFIPYHKTAIIATRLVEFFTALYGAKHLRPSFQIMAAHD
jgi:hypothetical protein